MKEQRFHVSPSANRDSILQFGLDWKRMGPTQVGIANGWPGRPDLEAIFLTDASSGDAGFFVRFGGGRRVDVWSVDVTDLPIEPGPDGWWICRATIEPQRLTLVEVWETDPAGRFGEPTPAPLPRIRRRDRKLR